MSGSQLQAVAADTSALVSLAIPCAKETVSDVPDPLQFLLSARDVFVPLKVISELRDVAEYQDIHAAAASNVLAADKHYNIKDPYQLEDAPDNRPSFGLDKGETDGIVLANAMSADGFLTDEFGGTNFALVHAALRGPRIVSAPQLICNYAQNGQFSDGKAKKLLRLIGSHRSWNDSPYVAKLLEQLGE